MSETLQKTQRELEAVLSRGHLSIDVDSLLGKIRDTFKEVEEELDSHRERHPDLFSNDHIRDTITSLFEGKVGAPYSQEHLDKIYKLGEERYVNQIPPGYKDEKGKRERVKSYGNLVLKEKYGDLILWFQIIDKAKETKQPIIFVTDETKEDWWWISKGKTIGPRPELITEIMIETDTSFYMYAPKRFVDYAKGYLRVQIAQEVIDEVQEVTESRNDRGEDFLINFETLVGEIPLSEEGIERNLERFSAELRLRNVVMAEAFRLSQLHKVEGNEIYFVTSSSLKARFNRPRIQLVVNDIFSNVMGQPVYVHFLSEEDIF